MENLNTNSHSTPLPEYLNPQIILFWKAPLRPYKKRSKHILRFYLAIALLLSAIILFFGDRVLLIPIWSLLFLFYILTITPPPIVENRVTKFGVETAGITMRWEVLSHFYFTQRFGYDVLTIVTHEPYSLHSYLVVPTAEIKSEVMAILSEHIMFQDKPQRTMTDRMVDWLSHLIPDDDEESETNEKIPEETKDISDKKETLWEDLKHPMNFFMHATSQDLEKVFEEQKKKEAQLLTSNIIDVPKQNTPEQQESIPKEVHTKITSPTTSSSSDPIQMPESLLRHISEPIEELPRQL